MSYSFSNPTTAASVIPYYDLEAFRAIAESCHEGQDACNSYVISLIKQMFGDAPIQAAPANAQRGFKKRKITTTEDQHLFKMEFLLRNQKLLPLLNPYLHNKGRLSGLQIIAALSIIQNATIKISLFSSQPAMSHLASAIALSPANLFDHFNQVMSATINLFSKQGVRPQSLREACIVANFPGARFLLGLGPIGPNPLGICLNFTITHIIPGDDGSFNRRINIIRLLTRFIDSETIGDCYLTAFNQYRGFDVAYALMENHRIGPIFVKEVVIQASFNEDKLKDPGFISEYLIFCENHNLLDFQKEGLEPITTFLLATLRENHFETAEFVVNKFDLRFCDQKNRNDALLVAAEKDLPNILQAMLKPGFIYERSPLLIVQAMEITIMKDNLESFKVLLDFAKQTGISAFHIHTLIQAAEREGRPEMLQYLRTTE